MKLKYLRRKKLEYLLYEKSLLKGYSFRLDKDESKKSYRKQSKELLDRKCMELRLKNR